MKFSAHYYDYPSAYESFNDVPDDMKLRSFETEFDGLDVIHKYVSLYYNSERRHERTIRKVKKAMSEWEQNCVEQGRDPILASPETVDVWCQKLLQDLKPMSIKCNYLSFVNRLYRYLMWHVDYPHCYNPVQFAVREYSASKTVWNVEVGN